MAAPDLKYKVTVELTAWECERLVLVKLDKAFNQIIEIYKPYKEVL